MISFLTTGLDAACYITILEELGDAFNGKSIASLSAYRENGEG